MNCPRLPAAALGLVLTATLPVTSPAQCRKPPLPPAGLPTAAAVDVPLTYSDGYKTLLDFTYPTQGKPSCGWPLVVLVHGYGGKRSVQRPLAARGYAVVTYDVRGQGDAKRLNPATKGLTFYGPVEKYDLAEVVRFARKRWSALVDPNKLAVLGGSQGGIHAWFAAAYSGRRLTILGRGTIVFPKVDCALPTAFVPDVADHVLRGGTLFSMDALERMLTFTSAVLDPAVKTRFLTAFKNQDPAGLAAWLAADPGRAVRPLLASASVPILYTMAWTDGIQTPHEAMAVLAAYKGPIEAALVTGGHGAPWNLHEGARGTIRRDLFLDRWLWGRPTGAGNEGRYGLALPPLDPSARTSPTSLWEHRVEDRFPPPDVRPLTYYLDAKGTLSPKAPAAGPATVIRHRVPPGYTPAAFMTGPRTNRSLGAVLAKIPLSRRTFTSAPLATGLELAGHVKLSLVATASAPRFTLHAELRARIPGAAGPVFLAGWAYGALTWTPNRARRIDLDLGPVACLCPQGTVFELALENHWIRRYAKRTALVTAPFFVSCDLQVAQGTGSLAPRLELPARMRRALGLVADREQILTRWPAALHLELRGGAGRAGKPALILAGFSGRAPGLALPGGRLRLQPDAATWALLGLYGGPLFPGFASVLDRAGRAAATANFPLLRPLPSSLTWRTMDFAAWAFENKGSLQGSPSNPIRILFR